MGQESHFFKREEWLFLIIAARICVNLFDTTKAQPMASWKLILKEALRPPLPGPVAHAKMLPDNAPEFSWNHDKSKGIQSSVLILLYPYEDRILIPFIQRPVYPGYHSGQISLPGGKCEEVDSSYWETALRETREELGIDTDEVEYLGQLSRIYIDRSNFFVNPQVGFLKYTPQFNPDPKEVAEVLKADITELATQPRLTDTMLHPTGIPVEMPYFNAGGKHIWGATAMIICELIQTLNTKYPAWINALHSCSGHTSPESL